MANTELTLHEVMKNIYSEADYFVNFLLDAQLDIQMNEANECLEIKDMRREIIKCKEDSYYAKEYFGALISAMDKAADYIKKKLPEIKEKENSIHDTFIEDEQILSDFEVDRERYFSLNQRGQRGGEGQMNILQFAQQFSDNIIMLKQNDDIYILDNYLLGKADCNFGVWNHVSIEDLKSGDVDIEDVTPAIYIDDYVDFLLDKDLELTYGVDKETIKGLYGNPFSEWGDILTEKGYADVAKELSSLIDPFRNPVFEPVTEDYLNECIEEAYGYAADCIDQFVAEYENIEKE